MYLVILTQVSSSNLFNYQWFKAKTLQLTSIIYDHLFVDDAALVATSLEEPQELVDHFSNAIKALRLTISIKKREVIHQPLLNLKQIRGVKQKPPAHTSSQTIKVDWKNLKYM